MADAGLLFAWRNDALTRAMSISTDALPWERHIAWLSDRLARENPALYIAEQNGAPVGTIRIDGDRLSYTTAPEHRGGGVATAMLRWALSEFGVLTAEIKPANIPSIRAAESAGHRVVLLAHSHSAL